MQWLENLDTPAVRQWVEAENKISRPKLAALPLRARFRERVEQLAAQPRDGLPHTRGGHTYFVREEGGHGMLLAADTSRPLVQGAPVSFAPDPAGALIAYTHDGETWQIVRADGEILPDRLRATSLAWAPDSQGVYYSGEGQGRNAAVYFHRLGQENDTLVYAAADPALVPEVQVAGEAHYLVITVKDGLERSGVELLDLSRQGKPFAVVQVTDTLHTFIGASSERLYFIVSRTGQSGRVVALNAREPLSGWTGVLPEMAGTLEQGAFIGNHLVTSTLEDGRSVVRVYSPEGRPAGDVALPGAGHVEGFTGQAEAFFSYTDYLTPPTVFRLDLGSRQARPWRTARAGVDTSVYATERLTVPGLEGTSVSVDVTRRRDRARDGDQPLVLQAAGRLAPSYSPEVHAWLELGGAYAQVSVRPERPAGGLQPRESGLDHLQAAADFLVRERYTRTRRLGLYGRGTSALAAAAAVTGRPEGYGAAVLQLTVGPGDDTRPSLDTFAPYRRVRKGLCYPPVLITTLDRNPRVAPWEGYKLAAALQAVQLCSNPILLRVDPRTSSVQREVSAEQWAFMAQWLGLEPPTS
jgi:prolyl oligopeptidase